MFLTILLNIIFSFFSSDSRTEIENAVLKKLADYDSVKIVNVQMPKVYDDVQLNQGFDIKLSGNFCYVPVFIINKGVKSNGYVQVDVKLFNYSLVAKTSIKKDEELSFDNTEVKMVEVTMLRGRTVSEAELNGKIKSKSFLSAGDVVYESLVAKVPVILKGSNVVLNSVKGNILVSIDAVAKQDGAVGDVITVQTQDRKQFKGKVIDTNNILKVEWWS